MKKIGLFGGSFDPVHIGHISIATIALKELGLDEVQLIPTGHNPWKDDNHTEDVHRLNMLKLALKDEENITINTIELDDSSNEKNYTVYTLEKLISLNPDVKYYYIMGMDQANAFDKWKDAHKISELVQLVTFHRGGYTLENDNIAKYNFIVLENEPIHASSTEIRNGCIDMLSEEVLKYIVKEGLYLEGIISAKLKGKRWEHSISVANLAKEIAIANGLDGKQAYVAGMFHDIAKQIGDELTYQMMEEHYKEHINSSPFVYHQWISRYMSEHIYLIEDEVVLNAIEHHTTAHVDISPIGKCVYVADKLDPLRGYDVTSQIALCKENIHEGFKQSLIDFYEFSKAKNRTIDDCFYDIYDKFVVKGEI